MRCDRWGKTRMTRSQGRLCSIYFVNFGEVFKVQLAR